MGNLTSNRPYVNHSKSFHQTCSHHVYHLELKKDDAALKYDVTDAIDNVFLLLRAFCSAI